ncbi:MAG: hypothetical protein WD342_10960 [Verrucomicrobiales bacterium]
MKPAFVVFAAGLGLLVPVEAKADRSKVQHFVQSVRTVVADLEKTEYQHRTEIDEGAKTYLCDCSGFLGYLLKRDFPRSYESLKGDEAPWRKRPLAVTFHETIVRSGVEKVPGWSRVDKMTDLRPGDVIAWRKAKVVRGTSTGHVLLVVKNLGFDPDGRLRVRVIDSTSRIHADDTRPKATDGVGEGTMWFALGEDDEPIAYYVDAGGKPGKSSLIAIGRLEDQSAD